MIYLVFIARSYNLDRKSYKNVISKQMPVIVFSCRHCDRD